MFSRLNSIDTYTIFLPDDIYHIDINKYHFTNLSTKLSLCGLKKFKKLTSINCASCGIEYLTNITELKIKFPDLIY